MGLQGSDAKTHSLDLKSQENARKKDLAKILRCWPAMRKIGALFKIERCEMLAIRTPAAVWPAMRASAMPESLAMWVERCEPLSLVSQKSD